MAAGEISADGIRSARGLGTFVDINASGAQWLEAITAETLAVQAFRIIDTIEISLADGPHIHLSNSTTKKQSTIRIHVISAQKEKLKEDGGCITFERQKKNIYISEIKTEIDDSFENVSVNSKTGNTTSREAAPPPTPKKKQLNKNYIFFF